MLAIFGAAAAIAAAYPAAATAATVWAVGDGATATSTEDDDLGDFIAAKRPLNQLDRFLYLGDVYETGTIDEFNGNYGGAFGAFKDISRPTPGDNEWANVASGYDPYWGTLAPRQPGGGRYYSFEVGGWHVVSLNSNQSTSAQLTWLRGDLAKAANNGTCTIAMIHEPPNETGAVWDALEGHAVAVLSGHVHNYQRHVAQRGITQFIVGTGGRTKVAVATGGRVLSSTTATGALKLTLQPGSGRFDFFVTDALTPRDSSSLNCRAHGSKPPPLTPTTTAGTTAPAGSTSPTPGFSSAIATTASTATARISLRRPSGVTRRRGFTVVGRSQGARGAIRLSLVRRVGRRCQAFDGRRFRRSSCRARAVLKARGRGTWSYRFRRPLPRGSYLLSARIVDAQGAVAWASRRLTVR